MLLVGALSRVGGDAAAFVRELMLGGESEVCAFAGGGVVFG